MMRTTLFAAALLLGSAAIAQNTMPPSDPVPPPTPGEPMTTPPTPPSASTQPTDTVDQTANPTPATDTSPTMPADQQAMQQSMDMNATARAPVQSAAGEPIPAAQQPAVPATTGAGATTIVNPSPPVEQAFPPPAAPAQYPACSKTVTDSCIQLYEPGVSRHKK